MCRYSTFVGSSVVTTASSCLLYPMLRLQQSIVEPISVRLTQRKSIHELQQAYASLQKEYDALRADYIAAQATHCYAQDIAELIHFKKRYSSKAYIAQVLARHVSDQHQFFLVNVGTRQGIKKDMVALYENCLLGRVVEVYPWYCKICLITDSECKVSATCLKTGASGILEGSNNEYAMALQYVSHLDCVETYDMIVSSGDGLIFPNGFGLGTIEQVKKEGLFYNITVKPLLDWNSLRYCIVLAKDDIENGAV